MNTERLVPTVLGGMLLIVLVQSFVRMPYTPEEREPVVEVACEGIPIEVEYAFTGGYLEPWACQVQCEDDVQRYVLYSNGKATQCSPPPACNDLGEDTGVTCIPPLAS